MIKIHLFVPADRLFFEKGSDFMKLEKLSDTQIRCTLSKEDLSQRQLHLSEVAYGSEKAKELFRDMMQQSSIELGFEADNIPLMIEAIPISNDCLVLVVTKVEAPDDLDTRFSRFSKINVDDSFDEDFSDIYAFEKEMFKEAECIMVTVNIKYMSEEKQRVTLEGFTLTSQAWTTCSATDMYLAVNE